jgi:TRAP-type transport system periplasmic protein
MCLAANQPVIATTPFSQWAPLEAQEFRRKSRALEIEWQEDMNKRGYDGRKLIDTARALIEKHSKAPAAKAPAKKA